MATMQLVSAPPQLVLVLSVTRTKVHGPSNSTVIDWSASAFPAKPSIASATTTTVVHFINDLSRYYVQPAKLIQGRPIIGMGRSSGKLLWKYKGQGYTVRRAGDELPPACHDAGDAGPDHRPDQAGHVTVGSLVSLAPVASGQHGDL